MRKSHKDYLIAKLSVMGTLAFVVVCLPLLSSCVPSRRGDIQRVVRDAGKQEVDTIASWVKGGTEKEKAIIDSSNGQWAKTAVASTSMGHVPHMPEATPVKATGPPDVAEPSVDSKAWGPSKENAGYEWIELEYEAPVHATSVRIRETNGCGSVVMVQLKDKNGIWHKVWQGRDRACLFISWLVLTFPRTSYLVDTVKITMDTRLSYHWKMIDAVQLVGSP